MGRPKVPKAIQTTVLTSSKRRCCICFGLNGDLDIKKGQIAHIHHDSSNNIPENLAFLCLNHHDEYDSKTSQAKSILDSEVKAYLADLYHYWETPKRSLPTDIERDVLQEMSLIPHSWKNEYTALYPGHFSEGSYERKRAYINVWDMFSDVVEHKYTDAEWTRYEPLFNQGIPRIIDKLEKLTLIWGDYLGDHAKHLVLKLCSRLETQRRAYPVAVIISRRGENTDKLFTQQFILTLVLLGEFSSEIDRIRETTT